MTFKNEICLFLFAILELCQFRPCLSFSVFMCVCAGIHAISPNIWEQNRSLHFLIVLSASLSPSFDQSSPLPRSTNPKNSFVLCSVCGECGCSGRGGRGGDRRRGGEFDWQGILHPVLSSPPLLTAAIPSPPPPLLDGDLTNFCKQMFEKSNR